MPQLIELILDWLSIVQMTVLFEKETTRNENDTEIKTIIFKLAIQTTKYCEFMILSICTVKCKKKKTHFRSHFVMSIILRIR